MEGQEQERAITWNSVRLELNSARKPDGQIDYDKVRRRKLAAIEAYTGRPVITYATDFLSSKKLQLPEAASGLQVTPADMEGLAEVVKGLEGDGVFVESEKNPTSSYKGAPICARTGDMAERAYR